MSHASHDTARSDQNAFSPQAITRTPNVSGTGHVVAHSRCGSIRMPRSLSMVCPERGDSLFCRNSSSPVSREMSVSVNATLSYECPKKFGARAY
jgi:hypothetical protein